MGPRHSGDPTVVLGSIAMVGIDPGALGFETKDDRLP